MPTHLRKKRIFADFQHNNTSRSSKSFGEKRSLIFKRLKATGLVDGAPTRIPRSQLWKTKGEYAFSKWLKQFQDAFTNPSYRTKLTNAYWMSKILQVRQNVSSVSSELSKRQCVQSSGDEIAAKRHLDQAEIILEKFLGSLFVFLGPCGQ